MRCCRVSLEQSLARFNLSGGNNCVVSRLVSPSLGCKAVERNKTPLCPEDFVI